MVRAIVHIPHGILIGICMTFNPHLGWIFGGIFLVYELNEDWDIRDRAWIDLRGCLIGLAIVATYIIIYRFN